VIFNIAGAHPYRHLVCPAYVLIASRRGITGEDGRDDYIMVTACHLAGRPLLS
jgi:hypothetical protein